MNQLNLINISKKKIDVIDIQRKKSKKEPEDNWSAFLSMIVPAIFITGMIVFYIVFGY